MHKSFRRAPTAEERRVVRNWTFGVLIVYGAVVLAAFGLASLIPHPGSKEPVATVTATAGGTKSSR